MQSTDSKILLFALQVENKILPESFNIPVIFVKALLYKWKTIAYYDSFWTFVLLENQFTDLNILTSMYVT